MGSIELKKSLFGGYTIGYDCPNCKARLKSPLSDAGQTDTCPDCKRQFTVPGTDEREKLRVQNETEELERKRIAIEKQAVAAERRKSRSQKKQNGEKYWQRKRSGKENRRNRWPPLQALHLSRVLVTPHLSRAMATSSVRIQTVDTSDLRKKNREEM